MTESQSLDRLVAAVERLESLQRVASIRAEHRWIGAEEIAAMTGFKARTIAEKIVCKPGFPKPMQIDGIGHKRWNYAEVAEYFQHQQRAKPRRQPNRSASSSAVVS